MGRPRKNRKTIPVRMFADTYWNLKTKFPNQSMGNLIDIAYNTSALRLEARLRKDVKKK